MEWLAQPSSTYKKRIHTHSHRRHLKRWVKAVLFFGVLILLLTLLDKSLGHVITDITRNEAEGFTTETVNRAIENTVKKNEDQNILSIQRDNNNQITAISTNAVQMNLLKNRVALAVQKAMRQGTHEVGVSIGTLTGSRILYSRGPKIPLKVSFMGNADVNFKSEFSSAGINQTRHRITVLVHTKVYTLVPGNARKIDVTTSAVVAETIIVGQVPQFITGQMGIK